MGAEKKPAKKISQQCVHDKMLDEADAYLAEIDQALGENTWHGPRPRLRRPRREQLGTTRHPDPGLSS